MPTFAVLSNWTDEGIRHIKGSPARLDNVKQQLEKSGCKMLRHFLTTGAYDMVMFVEADEGTKVEEFVLASNSLGNVRSHLVRVWPEDEYRQMIEEL